MNRILQALTLACFFATSALGQEASAPNPAVATSAAPASAEKKGPAPPRQIRFSGVVAQGDGVPANGDAVALTFSLYETQLGESPLWAETQTVTLDATGRYSVLLGATSNEGLPLTLFAAGEARWLGVRVADGDSAEQPRVQLVSVPYALAAGDAQTLAGRPVSDFTLSKAGRLASGQTAGGDGQAPGPVTSGPVSTIAGTTVNRIAKFTGVDVIGNSNVVDDGTNVISLVKLGVGTTPTSLLSVNGSITQGTPSAFEAHLVRIDGTVLSSGAAQAYLRGLVVNPTYNTSAGYANYLVGAEVSMSNRVGANIAHSMVNYLSNSTTAHNGSSCVVNFGIDVPNQVLSLCNGIYGFYENSSTVTKNYLKNNLGIGSISPNAPLQIGSTATTSSGAGFSARLLNLTGTVSVNAEGQGYIRGLEIAPQYNLSTGYANWLSGAWVNLSNKVGGNVAHTIVGYELNSSAAYNGTTCVAGFGIDVQNPPCAGNFGFFENSSNATKNYFKNNVGINNNAPTEKLDVTGNIKASGTITSLNFTGTGLFALPTTTNATTGVITLAGNRFIHSFGTNNTFVGQGSGNFTMSNGGNTAIGASALASNTTGGSNTASGVSALATNTTGFENTAVGINSLQFNTSGANNTATGTNALRANTTASGNTAFGHTALSANTTGASNTAVGFNASKFNTIGVNNSAVGDNALTANTTGSSNTAIGQGSLLANTTASNNAAVGASALRLNTSPYNSALGANALFSNTTGSDNSAVGESALLSNTTGSTNIALGSLSLDSNTVGSANSVVGIAAMGGNTTGNNNVAVGFNAGVTSTPANANTTGSSNTFLGYQSGPGTSTQLTNATAIGANALVSANNSLVLGDSAVNVGIGTATPSAKLHVVGTVNATSFVGDGSGLTGLTGAQTGNVNTFTANQNFNAVLNMAATTSSTAGVINSGGSRFLHNYGTQNIFTGVNAGNFTMTGTGNTATGFASLTSNTTGGANTAHGLQTLISNTTGFNNTAMGGQVLLSNTSGGANTGTGAAALFGNTIGNSNTATGTQALNSNTSGSNNTALGALAGYTATPANANTTGNNNTFIGYRAGPGTASQLSNASAIGANALVSASNSLVLGDSAVNVGIGTTTPSQKLHVAGNILASGSVTAGNFVGSGSGLTGIVTSPTNTGSRLARFTTTGILGDSQIFDNGSNIGIGTTTPSALFHVNAVAGDAFNLYTSTTVGGSVAVYANHFGAASIGYAGFFTKSGAGSTNIGLYAEASGATNNYAALFQGGNVGIGTSSPTQRLQVAGMVYSTSGGFKFPDGTVQTTAATGAGGGAGDITGVAAGNGLTGGGTSGDVALAVDATVARTNANNNFSAGQNITGNVFITGNASVSGTMIKGAGSFKIDHPQDPSGKYLSHSFVESPDMKNVYDGLVTLDKEGEAWIELPSYFQALNRDFRYQLTCVGGYAPVYVSQKVADNRFKISGGKPGLEISWQVTGIRQDAYANAHRIPNEEEKVGAERGTYIHPELFPAQAPADARQSGSISTGNKSAARNK